MSTRSDENLTATPVSSKWREMLGIFLLAVALFLGASLLSAMLGGENWMGILGSTSAYGLYSALGFSSLFIVYAMFQLAFRTLRSQSTLPHFSTMLGFFGMVFFTSLLLHLGLSHQSPSGMRWFSLPGKLSQAPAGGSLGASVVEILIPLIGMPGLLLLCIAGSFISIIGATSLSHTHLVIMVKERLSLLGRWVRGFWNRLWPQEEDADLDVETQRQDDVSQTKELTTTPTISKRSSSVEDLPLASGEQAKRQADSSSDPPSKEEPTVVPRPTSSTQNYTGDDPDEGNLPKSEYIKLGSAAFQYPPLEILDFKEQRTAEVDKKAMLELAQKLEKSLADYQVKGRVTQIHPGPVVTMYEFAPSPGTKLSKITALSSDLAMALEALRVRIVAPIPGKAAVGIEVPNSERETVYLKEILADDAFAKARSKLTIALGKDISGLPVSVDLSKMPHLLIAGTTGSGKSVAVNVMICSVLFRASPDDVKMIMIDPKMLELSIYEGIPHLLLPVVTDPKKANLALKWAVDEMERRYDLISKSGTRDIAGYNQKVEETLMEGTAISSVPQEEEEGYESSPDIATPLIDSESQLPLHLMKEPPRKLPYIIVIIDEFADLMMVASKEVEVSVARIAQKARAAGIHLVLATQRPSVDVITGLIKANFPSRIAFQVASRIDSRTILDTQGAEALLGMGDMLFTDRGQALRRIHGALIHDKEVHRLVEHLKKQGRPIYNMDILKPREEEGAEDVEEEFADDMYDEAVRLVIDSRQASISMVQRRLRIGYNRAARMIERMEREGIVSAADGAKGREVLAERA